MLISDAYREQNAQLHRENIAYGRRGARHVAAVKSLATEVGATSVLDYGCGKGLLGYALRFDYRVQNYDPCIPGLDVRPRPADVVVCTDVLEHVEPDCLDAVLADIARLTVFDAHIVIATKPDGSKTLPDGRDPHLIVQPPERWRATLERHFGSVVLIETGRRDVTFRCQPGLTVVTWQWGTRYTAEHVNRLASQVREHYKRPHRFVALCEHPSGLDGGIDAHVVPTKYADVVNPSGDQRPRCYRRLWMFSQAARGVLGRRFVSLDLDMTILGDVTALWQRDEPFVIWADPSPNQPYNGGMILMNAGYREDVWSTFDPVKSPALTKAQNFIGSDQAWISHCLGTDKPVWTKADGVYSFVQDLRRGLVPTPADARIIMYHGKIKPWVDKELAAC